MEFCILGVVLAVLFVIGMGVFTFVTSLWNGATYEEASEKVSKLYSDWIGR